MSVTAVMALAVMLVGATAALAQYPPDQDFGVVCTPQDPQPGQTVTCQVSGAQAAEVLSATAEADTVFYEDTMSADEAGEAGFGFDVPAEVQGQVVVTVAGDQSGTTTATLAVADDDEAVTDDDEAVTDDDDEAVAEIVTPDDVEEGDTLPFTGGDLAMLSLVGFGLVGAGGFALRKRSSAKA